MVKIPKNGQNGLKLSKMVGNGLKWSQKVRNGKKWFKMVKMVKTLSPLVSLMYQAKCIHPRVNNSPIWGPKFMAVCYSVVWYCMLGHGMVWVLSIDGCSLQMGAKHPSVENTHL